MPDIFSQENPSCRAFTNKYVNLLRSKNYLSDAHYNSVRLVQGDKIEVYKPFFREREYIIIVSCDPKLPGVNVSITDMGKNIIYKSEKTAKEQTIEISPKKNQNLIISVKTAKSEDYPKDYKGCVSIVIGFKKKNQ